MKNNILKAMIVAVTATSMITGCSSRVGSYVYYNDESTSTSVAGSFAFFDGKIKKVIEFDSDKSMTFTFDSDCTDGAIEAVIMDKETNDTVYDFSAEDSTVIDVESGKKYEVVITLDDTKNGCYSLQWEE